MFRIYCQADSPEDATNLDDSFFYGDYQRDFNTKEEAERMVHYLNVVDPLEGFVYYFEEESR